MEAPDDFDRLCESGELFQYVGGEGGFDACCMRRLPFTMKRKLTGREKEKKENKIELRMAIQICCQL